MLNKLWSAEVFASTHASAETNKLWSAEVFASAHASAETDALQIRQLATEWAGQLTVLRVLAACSVAIFLMVLICLNFQPRIASGIKKHWPQTLYGLKIASMSEIFHKFYSGFYYFLYF